MTTPTPLPAKRFAKGHQQVAKIAAASALAASGHQFPPAPRGSIDLTGSTIVDVKPGGQNTGKNPPKKPTESVPTGHRMFMH